MAMSVLGYIPARIERHGSSLVLVKNNQGSFGGSVLGPEFPINSYPIVSENSKGVVVDLSKPESPYGLTTVGLASGDTAEGELLPRAQFLKSAQVDKNRVSFNTVVALKSSTPLFEKDDDSAEAASKQDPFLLTLSLRTDWVIPTPSPEFQVLKASSSIFGLFTSAPLVTNGGLGTDVFVNRISVDKAQVWEMSENTPADYQQAVRDGVLAWNDALPKKALEVRLGTQMNSFTDPAHSNVVWDDNEAIGMAFANWRSNPYTGEIVQAQVYMSGSMWAENGKLVYQSRKLEKTIREAIKTALEKPADEGATPGTPGGSSESTEKRTAKLTNFKKQLSSLRLEAARLSKANSSTRRSFVSLGMGITNAESLNYCQRPIDLKGMKEELNAVGEQMDMLEHLTDGSDADKGNKKSAPAWLSEMNPMPNFDTTSDIEFSKQVVRAVVMHEVGHTLGLRHNFIASTETSDNGKIQSGSIMDYNDLMVDAQFNKVGDSDRVVLGMGYNGDAHPSKKIRFCTDQDAGKMPDCQPFDFAKNPLDGMRIQNQTAVLFSAFNMSQGNSSKAIQYLIKSLRNMPAFIKFAYMSEDEGMMAIRDVKFGERQKQALAILNEARTTLWGLEFPDSLKSVYNSAILSAMMEALSPAVVESANYADLLDLASKTLVNADSSFDRDVRRDAVTGLVKMQDVGARQALIDAAKAIEARLNPPSAPKPPEAPAPTPTPTPPPAVENPPMPPAPAVPAPTPTPPAARVAAEGTDPAVESAPAEVDPVAQAQKVDDEEVLIMIQNALKNGYFKALP